MQPIYVSKQMTTIAASSGVGTTSSSPVTATLITSALDTARRVIVSASTMANISSLLVTVNGTGQNGQAISETVRGSTGAAGTSVTTVSDFLTVTSISFSSLPEPPLLYGTSSMAGTPWTLANWHVRPVFSAFVTLNTSQAQATWEFTLDDPSRAYPKNGFFLSQGYVVPAPAVIASTMISAVVGTSGLTLGSCGTYGFFTNPIAAWRITMASTGTTYAVMGTVIQSGLGG